MAARWEDVRGYLVSEATRDLEAGAPVRPCLVAFAGDRLLLSAFMRDFPKGGYHDPLIELIALAIPLGADRLAFSISGRAWSLLDPMVPVLSDAEDLRQRVLVVDEVDGHRRRPRATSWLVPFDLTGTCVRWQKPRDMGRGEGWIQEALLIAVRTRNRLRGPVAEMRAQALRCARLGHLVGFAPEVVRRLGLESWCAPARLDGSLN